jgi:hypothetical protein
MTAINFGAGETLTPVGMPPLLIVLQIAGARQQKVSRQDFRGQAPLRNVSVNY